MDLTAAGFGAALTDALPELRAMAESRMRATCTIVRDDPESDPVVDDDGAVTVPTVPVYAGKCRIRFPGMASGRIADASGATVVTTRPVVSVPVGTDVQVGDVVTITADLDNAHVVGRRYRVEATDEQSQATAQRLVCMDYQAGVA